MNSRFSILGQAPGHSKRLPFLRQLTFGFIEILQIVFIFQQMVISK